MATGSEQRDQFASVIYGRVPETLWRRVGDGLVVLPPSVPGPLRFGPLVASVWRALEVPSATEKIVREVATRPEGDAEGEAGEVVGIIGILLMLGAIEELGSA